VPNPPNALELVTVLRQSPIEGRRGVVRLHPDALLALGARPWSVLALRGARTTGALAALLDDTQDPRSLACDDLILANLGVGQAPGSRSALPQRSRPGRSR
jgi:transitional endoplasmic reticulum ATPase